MIVVSICVSLLVEQDDKFWDKVGQAIGTFPRLGRNRIDTEDRTDDDDETTDGVDPTPESEILARILSHV
jgi:hypothetical protein